ncbi:MAG: c-type cytochrome [Leptospiraceae bacterium]|nr:c-type cytochrome [Leptospiraceae bacterium]MCB1315672.1 c-type cytochrome [Leptospiraceae bacterium]MCB1320478.1 c-type cytochrome [Leptospiraceae bacterium]
MSQGNEKGVPNWILFLFMGTIVLGGLYAIFMHGFLGYNQDNAYRPGYIEPADAGCTFADIPANTAAARANGEATYKNVCAACHGQNMEGQIGPSLADAEWWHTPSPAPVQDVACIVVKGVNPPKTKGNAGPMPARGNGALSDREIFEVLYFVGSKNNSLVTNQ